MRTRTAWLVCLTLGCMLLTLLAPRGAQLPTAATATAATTHDVATHLAEQCEAPMLTDVSATETGVLSGEVLSEDGEPRAEVTLVAVGPWGIRQSVRSDAAGSYQFDALPAGRYTLRALDSSGDMLDVLSPATVAVAADMDAELVLRVAEQSATAPEPEPEPAANTSEDIRLAQTGTITGQVTAEDTGEPLRNVSVRAYTADGTVEDTASTNSDGFYELADIPNGTYRLRFNPASFGTAGDYAFEYYNDASTLSDADEVEVNDNTVTDINAALPLGGFITGEVTGANTGLPLNNINIRVFESDQRPVDGSPPRTESTGVYSVSQLREGTYFIEFVPSSFGPTSIYAPEYYNNQRTIDAADEVAVTSDATTFDIDAALETSGTLTGQVTGGDTGNSLEDVRVTVYDSAGEFVDNDLTDATGTYSITGLLSDTYRIEFDPPFFGPDSLYLEEFYDDKETLEDADPVSVQLDEVVTIDAVLDQGSTIAGQVTGGDTGSGLEGVRVRVYDSADEQVDNDLTDATGTYSITGLLSDTYRIEFDPPFSGPSSFYLGEFYDDKETLEDADPIGLPLNSSFTADAVLDRGSTIAGQVTGSDTGSGLEGVRVTVYDSADEFVDSEATDATGTYSITRLLSDTYRVEFSPFSGPSSLYFGEFYDDKETLEDADPISLPLNSSFTADAVLARGGIIQGQVTAEDTGASLEDVQITVYNSDGNAVNSFEATDSTGAYSVTGLLSDTYRIEFEAPFSGPASAYLDEYYDDQESLQEATPVAVQLEADVTVDAALTRGATISGQVTDAESGEGIDAFSVWLYGDDGERNFSFSAEIDASGAYTITGLRAGSYYLVFAGEDNYLDQAYNNQSLIGLADLLTVTESENVTDIDAALEQGGGIAGQVTAADTSAGLEDVSVIAYDFCTGDRVSGTATDENGNYTINGLPTGSYWVLFDTDFTDAAAYLPEYYDDLGERGTLITVNAPDVTEDINAELALGGVIAGTVTAEDTGEPLDNVFVDADGTDSSSINFIQSDRTTISGTYRIEGLSADTYTIEFESPSFGESGRYLDEYYNDQASEDNATPVQIALGEEATSIDAALPLGGIISGEVTAEADGEPLENIDVLVNTTDGQFINSASTNITGTYSVVGVPPGEHILRYVPRSNTDYIAEYYDDALTSDQATSVTVSGATEVENINAVLGLGTSISGRVTAEDTGDGLFDVDVEIRTTQGQSFPGEETNSDGTYRIGGLPAGSYIIEFEPDSFGDSEDYLSEYYDNQLSASSATTIEVTLDQETTGIDAALALGGSISGRVTSELNGAGLSDVRVRLYDDNNNFIDTEFPNLFGFYTFSGLRPDSYKVFFDPSTNRCTPLLEEYYNDKPDLQTADPVEVTAGTTTTVDAQLAGGGAISGSVTADDTGNALADVRVRVYNSEGGVVATTDTNGDGTYTTPGLSNGSYRLEFDPPSSGDASGYVSEYYDDKATLDTADAVTVTAPDVTTDINAALAVGASITGTVTAEATSAALADVPVFVYDSTGAEVASTTTDADGTYTTGALADGTYRVRFGPTEGYLQEYYDDKGSLEAADPITVAAPNDTTGIDAALASGASIAGTVTAADTSAGLEDVLIQVYDSAGTQVVSTTTAIDGTYTTPAVTDGTYRVRFSPPSGYLEEYYDDKATLEAADPITVATPDTTTGIDAVLAAGREQSGLYLPFVIK